MPRFNSATSAGPARVPLPSRPGDARYAVVPELIVHGDSDPEGAEAIHAVATQLISQQLEIGRRGVAICGASRGVGVTFIAANLAVALSRAGFSILLLDANLHEPGVSRMIVPEDEAIGLQQILRSGDIPLSEAVRHDVMDNLSVLYAGGGAADASELLGRVEFKNLIGDCLRDYEFTIVDTPPANRSPDCLRVSRLVGYALVVARKNVSFVEDVTTLTGELKGSGIAVLGALMNGA